MRYERSKEILAREIMDLWEVAYDMGSFVHLLNGDEVVSSNYLQ